MDEFECISFFENHKKELVKSVENYNKRLIVNDIEKEIVDFENGSNRIFIYYGLRGIGKSTALYQIISKYPNCLFIDGSTIRELKVDFLKLITEYKKLKNYNVLLIDEINDIPNWGNYLKTFQDILGLKVIATGSSAIKISAQKKEILRRARFKEMQPLSFKEYLNIKYNINININKEIIETIFSEPKDAYQKAKLLILKIKEDDPNIWIHFREFIFNGFPQSFKNLNIDECADQIIDKIILNDFPEISGFNLTSIKKAKMIITAFSLYKPGDFSYDTIASNYSLSKNTVVEIINSFVVSSLLIETFTSSSFANKFRKKSKFIFSSSAIRYGLMKKHPGVDQNIGFLREDSFVSAMYYNGIDVTYLKDGRKQPDYLIIKDGKRSIIEIGGPSKNTKQLQKGFLLKDSDVVDVIGDICILPLYLVNLI